MKAKKVMMIAELSGNHNGDINRAIKLMEEAKKAGADAVKLQTYTADTITIKHDADEFIVHGGLWNGRSLYELYQEAHTPWEWHKTLFEKGKELDITVFSTPFDETAVDLLESLETPLYKIASFELVHHPLIAYVAQTKKPIIMSTGMASLEEICEAVEVACLNGCTDLTILHCVSEYPAPIEHCNLAMIPDLQKRFPNCKIGLSDHTLGINIALVAVALGAQVVEKHITLSRSEGGVDAAFSLEPDELKALCKGIEEVTLSIGNVNYQRATSERKSIAFRRSLYVVRDIKKGEKFTPENIKAIRPGNGLLPRYLPLLLGRKALRDYKYGTPVNEDFLKDEKNLCNS